MHVSLNTHTYQSLCPTLPSKTLVSHPFYSIASELFLFD